MTPRLSEVVAWERIARAFAAYAATGRTRWQTRAGLCLAISYCDVPPETSHTMHTRMQQFKPTIHEQGGAGRLLWWPPGRRHAGPRALFAQLMAELTREELG